MSLRTDTDNDIRDGEGARDGAEEQQHEAWGSGGRAEWLYDKCHRATIPLASKRIYALELAVSLSRYSRCEGGQEPREGGDISINN